MALMILKTAPFIFNEKKMMEKAKYLKMLKYQNA